MNEDEKKTLRNEYNRRWYAANKEELKAKQREEYQRNKEKEKERKRLYYLDNKEKVTQRIKRWSDANPDRVTAINLKFKKNNPDKVKGYIQNWRSKNKEHEKEYRKKNAERFRENGRKLHQTKYDNEPLYRLKCVIRSSIKQAFVLRNHKKTSKTLDILGCTFPEFKAHIESKFEPWMTWKSHGLYNGTPNYGWDLDHIIPVSSAQSSEDVIRLNHYTNFQPLCSFTNRHIKANKPNWPKTS